MRLTRKASRWIAFGVVAAVIVGAVVAINLSRSASKRPSNASEALQTATESLESENDTSNENKTGAPSNQGQPGAEGMIVPNEVTDADLTSGFTLENFSRSENKDGKKVWEISGEKGLISTSGDKARIEKTRLSFFREDNSEVILTAPKADLRIEGGLVNLANLSGGVFVEQVKEIENGKVQDYSASSASATFDRMGNVVTTNSTTTINSRVVTLTAGALRADLTSKKVFFLKGVETIIRPGVEGFSLPGQRDTFTKDKNKPDSRKPTVTKRSQTSSTFSNSTSVKFSDKSSNLMRTSNHPAAKKASKPTKSQEKKEKSVKAKTVASKVKGLSSKEQNSKKAKRAGPEGRFTKQ